MIEILYSFFAGLLTFLSPCVLPLLPSYLAYVGGLKVMQKDRIDDASRRKLLLHVVLFILGFSLVFISLGFAGSLLSKLIVSYREGFRIVAGSLLIFLGLLTLDLIPFTPLYKHLSLSVKDRGGGIVGSFVLGFTFGASWSPCVGPALSSVLIVSLGSENTLSAIIPLLSFSMGLGVPFFVSALIFDRILKYFSVIKGFARFSKAALGFLLILFGAILLTGLHVKLTKGFLRALSFF